MKVPFIDLKPVVQLVQASVEQSWAELLTNTEFVGGPTVKKLEARLAEHVGVQHVVSCGNGTDALLIALQALGIGPGKKVALPNLTFWASFEAIAQLGATPVLIDVDATLQMDFEELQRAQQKLGLDAVMLVHLMGWATPRLFEFRRYCADVGLPLIEDGAQSFGVSVASGDGAGESVYQGARVSTLSFYPAKVLGGCMDGGAMLTNDEKLAEQLRTLANHGRAGHFLHSHSGWNSRLSAMNAAFLLAVLDHVDDIIAERCRLAARYQRELDGLSEALQVHRSPEGVIDNGYLSVCTFAGGRRDDIVSRLSAASVGTGCVYPKPIDSQPPASSALCFGTLEQSREFCECVVNLPLYYGMSDAELDHVCAALRDALAAP